ncbi:SDR family NAD(P)-dependent oxidoreductase [Streptomyces sp. NPDC035033]|uniref:SDR family NAD(P)-dependent oxidoreductase n=1 Tax=Streptomyces sp. NPDC035033 TaxID=3155368 RepID=UPI003411E1FD
MARTFAAQGRHLALCARRTDRPQTLREEPLAAHPGIRVSVRELDVNDHQQVFDVFRAQGAGHLVAVSSMSAVRGLPRNLTTCAAGKAGLSALAEGIRAEMTLTRTPIAVTTLRPGHIATDLSAGAARTPLMTSTEKGARAMVRAIERERPEAKVPARPWGPMGILMRHLPLRLVAEAGR